MEDGKRSTREASDGPRWHRTCEKAGNGPRRSNRRKQDMVQASNLNQLGECPERAHMTTFRGSPPPPPHTHLLHTRHQARKLFVAGWHRRRAMWRACILPHRLPIWLQLWSGGSGTHSHRSPELFLGAGRQEEGKVRLAGPLHFLSTKLQAWQDSKKTRGEGIATTTTDPPCALQLPDFSLLLCKCSSGLQAFWALPPHHHCQAHELWNWIQMGGQCKCYSVFQLMLKCAANNNNKTQEQRKKQDSFIGAKLHKDSGRLCITGRKRYANKGHLEGWNMQSRFLLVIVSTNNPMKTKRFQNIRLK